MCMPTAVDPVKLTPLTRGSETNRSPTALGPITRFRTPPGKPAFSNRRVRNTADHGVSDEGLNTTVLPQASAGTILRTGLTTGKFHGVMAATTPSGSSTVKQLSAGRSLGKVCPDKRSASPAAKLVSAAARVTSPEDSDSTFPC